MGSPESLRFTKDHEWVRLDGKTAHIGITDYAQDSLGDIVYVELPTVGERVSKGDEVSNIESVKAAAPVYAPVSGTIAGVNAALDANPELLNQKPFETVVFSITVEDPQEMDALLDAAAYDKVVNEAKASK